LTILIDFSLDIGAIFLFDKDLLLSVWISLHILIVKSSVELVIINIIKVIIRYDLSLLINWFLNKFTLSVLDYDSVCFHRSSLNVSLVKFSIDFIVSNVIEFIVRLNLSLFVNSLFNQVSIAVFADDFVGFYWVLLLVVLIEASVEFIIMSISFIRSKILTVFGILWAIFFISWRRCFSLRFVNIFVWCFSVLPVLTSEPSLLLGWSLGLFFRLCFDIFTILELWLLSLLTFALNWNTLIVWLDDSLSRWLPRCRFGLVNFNLTSVWNWTSIAEGMTISSDVIVCEGSNNFDFFFSASSSIGSQLWSRSIIWFFNWLRCR